MKKKKNIVLVKVLETYSLSIYSYFLITQMKHFKTKTISLCYVWALVFDEKYRITHGHLKLCRLLSWEYKR